ncbi:MAG: hypothetical protein ACPG6T_03895, partial [Paracoccaceae bacterium]
YRGYYTIRRDNSHDRTPRKHKMTGDILTGVRLGSAVVWLMVIFRYAFNQVPVASRDIEINKKADRLWRFQNTLMASSIVLFFTPENILRVEGLISVNTGYALLTIGSALGCVCGVILLHMKDLLEGKSTHATGVYVLIMILTVSYSSLR